MVKTELNESQKVKLAMISKSILSNGKGILAADERASTLEKRFYSHTILNTPENRARFRELLFATPNLEDFIGGVILNEETFDHKSEQGEPLHEILLKKRIKVGVKLDKGLVDFGNGEKISVGLEDLRKRIEDPRFDKAEFAKWRSLFKITEHGVSQKCINENMKVLAKYARICQMKGKVPIVEPEIFYEGDYGIETMKKIAKRVYSTLFCYLNKYEVYLEGIIMKISFITPGSECKKETSSNEICMANVETILDTFPHSVKNIVFLSGGHSQKESISMLNEINKMSKGHGCIKLSYSFGRALTNDVLGAWKGHPGNIERAQLELLATARNCALAVKGEY